MRTQRNRAFTLVELLVVIGIIALLISILLPVLGRVKWQAKTVSCSARMRDVTLAVIMYANDNKGALPPRGNLEDPAASMDPTGTTVFNNHYEQNYKNAKGVEVGQQLGRMVRTRHLKTTKVYQCPAALNLVDTDAVSRDFSYYNFNPHIAFPTAAAASANQARMWWTRLPNYGKVTVSDWKNYGGTIGPVAVPNFRRAILTDPLYGNNNTDLRYATHGLGLRRAFNFAYPDGSVQTYVAEQWTARPIDSWQRFLDQSNALQHALDGGVIDWRVKWTNILYNAIPVAPR